jgi:hypothetical protein
MLRKIMLNDHIGGPAISEVNIGDYVKKGQLIAKPSGLGANVHASFQGTVTEITVSNIYPSGNRGLRGLSSSLAFRVSCVEGRPSLFINPPRNFPAA